MALKPPGSRSNISMLTSGIWSVGMIVVLVAGHSVLALLLYHLFTGSGGMADIAKFTSLPEWVLWLSIVAAIAMDGWIFYHDRKARAKALKR